jgi:hypothetical protein
VSSGVHGEARQGKVHDEIGFKEKECAQGARWISPKGKAGRQNSPAVRFDCGGGAFPYTKDTTA